MSKHGQRSQGSVRDRGDVTPDIDVPASVCSGEFMEAEPGDLLWTITSALPHGCSDGLGAAVYSKVSPNTRDFV